MKSAEQTLKEAGDLVAQGWSHDLPVKVDDAGNITHRCAGTAVASVPDGNPSVWRFLAKQVGGALGGLVLVNKDPDMTQEKMVGIFRAAEADARAVGA